MPLALPLSTLMFYFHQISFEYPLHDSTQMDYYPHYNSTTLVVADAATIAVEHEGITVDESPQEFSSDDVAIVELFGSSSGDLSRRIDN